MLSLKITKRNIIPGLRKDLRARAERVLTENALAVASIAAQLCPVDTGNLRASIAVETYAGHRAGYGVAKAVVAGAPYAAFVEFGTSRSAAQPFLTPAFEAVRPRLEKQLARIFAKNF